MKLYIHKGHAYHSENWPDEINKNWAEYEIDLNRALSSAIPIANEEEVMKWLSVNHGFYDIPGATAKEKIDCGIVCPGNCIECNHLVKKVTIHLPKKNKPERMAEEKVSTENNTPDWVYHGKSENSAHSFTEGSETKPEQIIIEAMTYAQFGSREAGKAIEEHMKEYFTRWPSYKDKFNHLEWYHIFLDFYESKIEKEIETLRSANRELIMTSKALCKVVDYQSMATWTTPEYIALKSLIQKYDK